MTSSITCVELATNLVQAVIRKQVKQFTTESHDKHMVTYGLLQALHPSFKTYKDVPDNIWPTWVSLMFCNIFDGIEKQENINIFLNSLCVDIATWDVLTSKDWSDIKIRVLKELCISGFDCAIINEDIPAVKGRPLSKYVDEIVTLCDRQQSGEEVWHREWSAVKMSLKKTLDRVLTRKEQIKYVNLMAAILLMASICDSQSRIRRLDTVYNSLVSSYHIISSVENLCVVLIQFIQEAVMSKEKILFEKKV